jgi:protein involved in plasmid replication-relaxation
MAPLCGLDLRGSAFCRSRVQEELRLNLLLTTPVNTPSMKQLEQEHFSLFRTLLEHCSFLTRRQIERIWTLPTNMTNKELLWLVSQKYLRRRNRGDSFRHFQTPVYYLGELGWEKIGQAPGKYRRYRLQVEGRAERGLEHSLWVYDVKLKFLLESPVKRIIGSEEKLWQETIGMDIVPDAWIQFAGGEAFIEVDRETERPIVVRKKLDRYAVFKASGRYRTLFPGCGFKVLFFTTTEARIESLERVTPSDDIWFCMMEEFLREKLVDHAHWFALRGFYALSDLRKKEVS